MHSDYVMWEGKGKYRNEIKDDLERKYPEGYWWLNADANWQFRLPHETETPVERLNRNFSGEQS